MSSTKIIFASVLVLLVLAASSLGWYFSASNTEKRLRIQTNKQQEVCEAKLANVIDILVGQAGVAKDYTKNFKELHIAVMEGRYSGNGGEALMNWIQENHNPNYTHALHEKVMSSIEAKRNEFFNEQKKMIAISEQHEIFINQAPYEWFFHGRGSVDFIVITNTQSRAAYETGVDDSTQDLF